MPGLPRPVWMIGKSGDCRECAEAIRDSLGDGQIIRITPPTGAGFFGPYRGQDTASWNMGNHYVVVLNGRVYDAFTPAGGEAIAD